MAAVRLSRGHGFAFDAAIIASLPAVVVMSRRSPQR